MTTTPAPQPLLGPGPAPTSDGWMIPDQPETCPVRVELLRIAQAVRDLRDADTPAPAIEVLTDWARELMRQHTALLPRQRAMAVEHLHAGASVPVALRLAALGAPVKR